MTSPIVPTEYFVILTLSKPLPSGGGSAQQTITGTVRVQPGATRAGLLRDLLNNAPKVMRDADVLFFSAEPNHISPVAPGEVVGGGAS
jgi:hypothetical protein